MQLERCRNGFAWLTMIGLIMISGLSAQADDAGQTSAAEDKPRAAVGEVKFQTIDKDGKQTGQRVIILEGNNTLTDDGDEKALNLVEGDVLITTDDGQQQSERILRIDAEPAGDVLAVRLADAAQAQELELGKYWIGVQINDVSPALRAQLNLDENRGVLVGEVLPDSPATKAGVKQYDILLAIGEHKIGSNEDVLKAVKAADGKDIRLTILRGGSERSVSVTPAERPVRAVVARPPEGAKELARWFQRVQPGAPLGTVQQWPNLQFDVVKPGQAFVLSNPELPLVRQPVALPESLSVTITREGKQPAKIKVKQEEREIETTEDKLGELPEDIRRYVEPMLGRPRATLSMRGAPSAPQRAMLRMNARPGAAADVLIPAPPGAEQPQRRVRSLPPGGPEGVEKRLEALERRLDELQRTVRPPDGGKGGDTKN
jgi:hypothetical protein